jgi:antitoxin YefM
VLSSVVKETRGSHSVGIKSFKGSTREDRVMNAVLLNEAELKLRELVEQVIADAEPTIVVTESGEQVVVLPLDEYNSWKETVYLLSSPANAEHLQRSMAEARKGNIQERELLDA